jgi:hypothetical protein
MKNSFRLAKKLNPDWCRFNVFIAVPGSKIYGEVVQEGLYSHRDDFITYVKTEEFDYNFLLEIQRSFHKKFYITPHRILRGGLKRILRYFKNLNR